MAFERLKKAREEPLMDSRLPHPYREFLIELRSIVQELRELKLKPPPPAVRIPGVPPAPSPSSYIDVVAHGLRKHGALLLANDYYVETIDLTVARSPALEFPKLSGIALTIFSNNGTFDLYMNVKDAPHKITVAALTYPQTLLIDWFNITTTYIGNTAQAAGTAAVLIAWKPVAAPPPIPAPTAALLITPADREAFHKMGDVNRDGIIDAQDLSLLSAAYGSKPGDPNWNPDCDLNGDGKVDGKDNAIASKNYGLTIEMWKAKK